MNKISIEELEKRIIQGDDIIDNYFDPNSTKIGQVYQTIERRKKSSLTQQNVTLTESMFNQIKLIAGELDISPDAVIKMMLKCCLDEDLLARK